MRVAVCDHQGKSDFLVARLKDVGVEIPVPVDDADVLLCDAPGLRGLEHVPETQQARLRGIPVVGYPHGGNVMLWPHYVDDPQTDVELVAGRGQKRIYDAFGINSVVVGWMYSQRQPFRAPPTSPRILFAPQHHASGPEITANAVAQAQLDGYDFFTHNGESIADAVAVIDQADVVVANDTFLTLAIALGKPTIALQWDRFTGVDGHNCPFDESYVYPISLDKVSLDAALELCRDEALIAEWRDLWVGGPLDVEAVMAAFDWL